MDASSTTKKSNYFEAASVDAASADAGIFFLFR